MSLPSEITCTERIGIGTTRCDDMIHIVCNCGEEFRIPYQSGWGLKFTGQLQFNHKCGCTFEIPSGAIVERARDISKQEKP
jgi:hypothetical protein